MEAARDDEEDFKFLAEDKSHLNDQTLEVQFLKKFNHELFVKKETNRMLKGEKNNLYNYLPGHKKMNKPYLQYEEEKRRFKNSKINSMMNYTRNNQELQLLISSGFIDDSESLKKIIDRVNDD